MKKIDEINNLMSHLTETLKQNKIVKGEMEVSTDISVGGLKFYVNRSNSSYGNNLYLSYQEVKDLRAALNELEIE